MHAQRFDRDHDALLNREELCALLVAFEFCRPLPAQGTPASVSRTPSQPTTPVVPTNPLARSSVGGSNSVGTVGLSGPELEQMQSRLAHLAPEQLQVCSLERGLLGQVLRAVFLSSSCTEILVQACVLA